jgi:dTDP-4-dehydrorhamnose reductase
MHDNHCEPSLRIAALAKLLIVGIDSPIGSAMGNAAFSRGHDVIGTTRRNNSGGPGNRIKLDLASCDIEDTVLPEVEIAILCASMSRFADCREQPELARKVNVAAPVALGGRLVRSGAQVILLSTSAVFDCKTPHVSADQPYSPRSVYGFLKAQVEAEILALGSRASVLRLTKVLDRASPLICAWITALSRRESIEAFVDHTISPIAMHDATAALLTVVDDVKGGIYQWSGAYDISYADIARYLAHRVGAAPELVKPVRAVDIGIPVNEVTPYTSMDTKRLTALTGWSPPQFTDVIEGVYSQLLPNGKQ